VSQAAVLAAGAASVDYTALIMAVSGAVASIAGVFLSRRGQKDAAVQQVAVQRLSEQKAEHDIYRDLVTDLRAEVARLYDANARERASSDALVAHLRDTIETLRSVVLSEVATHLADDAVQGVDEHLAEHGRADGAPAH